MGSFSHPFSFLVVSKGSFTYNSKTARKKNFSSGSFQWSNFQLIPLCYNVNERIIFPLQGSLPFLKTLHPPRLTAIGHPKFSLLTEMQL